MQEGTAFAGYATAEIILRRQCDPADNRTLDPPAGFLTLRRNDEARTILRRCVVVIPRLGLVSREACGNTSNAINEDQPQMDG